MFARRLLFEVLYDFDIVLLSYRIFDWLEGDWNEANAIRLELKHSRLSNFPKINYQTLLFTKRRVFDVLVTVHL